MTRQAVVPAQGGNPERKAINVPTNAKFKITDAKQYVPIVTSSIQYHSKLLEQLKTGFKRTIKWTKCKSEMSNQAKNNNLNYLIDPAFIKANRLFVLSFENETMKYLFQSIIHQILK